MENPHGPASFWTQADALLRKNLVFQKRRKAANCRLILFPVILCAFLVVVRKFMSLSSGKQPKPFPRGYVCSDDELYYNFTLCWIPTPHEYPPLLQIPDSDYRAVRTAFFPFGDLPDGSCKKTNSCPVTVLVTGSNKSLGLDLAGRFFPRSSILITSDILQRFADGVFGSVSQPGEKSGPEMYLDSAFFSDDTTTIYNIQRRCRRNSSSFIPTGSKGMKEGIAVKCIKGLRLWRNGSSEINDEIFKGYPTRNSEWKGNEIVAAYDFLNSNNKNFNVSVWYKSNMNEDNQAKARSIMRVARSVNLVSNAYLEFLLGTNFKIHFEFVKEMPKYPDSTRTDDIISSFSTLFFTWIVLHLIPVIMTYLVYEKQQNIRIMTKMHGLGDGPDLMISYIYFLGLSSAYMLVFWASCLFLELGSFRAHDYDLQFVFFFLYINLQIALSFLVARMFSKVKTTSVVAYLIVFGTGLVGKFYLEQKVVDPSFSSNLVTVMELYPGLALHRLFFEFSNKAREATLSHSSGMSWEDLNDRSNGMKEVLIIMVAEWFVCLFVSYCLDNKSSIFCFRRKSNPFSQSAFLEDFDRLEKPDIAQEREKVEELLVRPDRSCSVICDKLRKVYPGMDGNPRKVAVHGLSLALARGECFGMLGPNGAGKSTFIKMMIGLTRPSAGTAFVEGLNIQTDMKQVYTSMGVCPQHDLLWETLTAREHLLFYGRLKNLKGPALHRAVEESLSSVNLLNGGVADKQAGKYSGGMKRRLSVAISLIGDPKVVYMDEPSTGLDPASRIELWKVVMRAKKERAIILTTHSMDEAEHLCDRLGIFVDGRLQCIGNAKQLKARYGGFYVFTITTSSENEQEMERLVRHISPSANKTYHLSGTQKFELPKNEVKIADMFEVVEAAKSKFIVQAWGIADTTLEDVFIKVACGAEAFNVT
ncbi:ABC transporter A family member 10-like [Rhododendron vialii]|uniref:ABC transporter A family member 10-like n=1 Tax=Rhododendron vialii TaxID=182163 RepID=UPI00265F8026|nr:ABC transporter A family member 10-like [Rhododendron vialii]